MVWWGFFCLQLKICSENTKKTRRLSKEEIKQRLIDSIFSNDIIETEELNEKADKVEKPKDAAAIIKQYEDIIRTKRKTLYPLLFIREKFLKDLKTRKSLSN